MPAESQPEERPGSAGSDRRTVTRPLVAAVLAACVAACGSDDSTSPPDAGSLVVTPERLVLGLGTSRQLTAVVLDEHGDPVADAPVAFSSSDPDRVSVTAEGLASYVGVGEAEIRVSSAGLEAIVPYLGMRAGHPLGAAVMSTPLPGDAQGDAPFGVAVDAEGRIFISQTNSGRLASAGYPVTGFATGELEGTPTSIALLGSGTALVTPTGSDNEDASLIELSSRSVLLRVPLQVSAFSAVTAADSHTAWLGTNDGRVLEFDVATSSITASIDLMLPLSRANHLALHPAGTLLYASSFTTGSISEIDLASRSVARTFFVGGEPQGIAVSSNGAELYVADESGTGDIDIYDLAGETLVTSIPSGAISGSGGPFGLAMTPDGARVYVGVLAGELDAPGLIQVIDVETRTIEHTLTSCGRMPRRIGFGFSGGLAVIPDETGCVNFVE